jgi:DNA-binding FrmR family transcriptional regulator
MARLTKEELLNQINNSVTDTDSAISLMENVSDSVDESVVIAEKDSRIAELESQVEALKTELEEFKNKYRERFLNAIDEVKEEVEKAESEVIEEEIASPVSTEVVEEGEVVNVTEI